MDNEITEEELNILIRLAKKVLWGPPEVRRKLQDQSVNIIPANFYPTIPFISAIENSFEYKNSGAEICDGELFSRESIYDFIDSISLYPEEFDPLENGDREIPEGGFIGRTRRFPMQMPCSITVC